MRGLLGGLGLAEGRERVGAVDLAAGIGHQERLERIPDAGLPVDQRAVAVEGEDRELGQVPMAHWGASEARR